MAFLFTNTSQFIGQAITAATLNMTGNLEATIYIIFISCIAFCLMFGIPLEFASIIIFPLLIVSAIALNGFMLPLVLFLMYFAIIITKTFIFR